MYFITSLSSFEEAFDCFCRLGCGAGAPFLPLLDNGNSSSQARENKELNSFYKLYLFIIKTRYFQINLHNKRQLNYFCDISTIRLCML